jgi:class 3 adenylate cyclase
MTADPPHQGPECRLQYIVLADLVASTATTRELGNDVGIYRMREFEDAARQALSIVKPRPSGRVVKTIGDAVLLTFDHFPHILCWKLELDASLQFKLTPEGSSRLRAQGMPRMAARVWIHVGEVEINHGDIHGLAVNELCKTEQAAKAHVSPGTIVATKAVREVAGPTLYPKQCKFTPLKGTGSRAGASSLFTIDISADIAFMISQQRKADGVSAHEPASQPPL